MHAIDTARHELAHATARGIGMPLAGGLYWLAMAAVAAFAGLPPKATALVFFVATGAIFPLGWTLTRLLGGDLMAKRPPLTQLGMLLNFVQLLYWPVLVAVFARDLMLVPFAMTALFGSHFLPYGWLYRSRGYALLGIGSVLLATLLQLALPAQAFVAMPLAMGLLYLLAAAMIQGENRCTRALAAASPAG